MFRVATRGTFWGYSAFRGGPLFERPKRGEKCVRGTPPNAPVLRGDCSFVRLFQKQPFGSYGTVADVSPVTSPDGPRTPRQTDMRAVASISHCCLLCGAALAVWSVPPTSVDRNTVPGSPGRGWDALTQWGLVGSTDRRRPTAPRRKDSPYRLVAT